METGIDWIIAKKFPQLNLFGAIAEKPAAESKNIFFRTYEGSETMNGITFSWDKGTQEFTMDGTLSNSGDLKMVTPLELDWDVGSTYTISVYHVSGTATLNLAGTSTNFAWGIFQNDAAKYFRGSLALPEFPEVYTFSGTAFEPDYATKKHLIFYFQCWRPGTKFDNYKVRVQIEKGTTSTNWEPYRGSV